MQARALISMYAPFGTFPAASLGSYSTVVSTVATDDSRTGFACEVHKIRSVKKNKQTQRHSKPAVTHVSMCLLWRLWSELILSRVFQRIYFGSARKYKAINHNSAKHVGCKSLKLPSCWGLFAACRCEQRERKRTRRAQTQHIESCEYWQKCLN